MVTSKKKFLFVDLTDNFLVKKCTKYCGFKSQLENNVSTSIFLETPQVGFEPKTNSFTEVKTVSTVVKISFHCSKNSFHFSKISFFKRDPSRFYGFVFSFLLHCYPQIVKICSSLAFCHIVMLSHCHVVTLSRCHAVTLVTFVKLFT